jgi:hypothetical protein
MTFQEIETLIASREKETIKYELKSFDKLFDKKDKDIAAEIVALANRFGGIIIFGISNSGEFEGKFQGDIDKTKENLYNLSRDSISPSIDLQVSLLEGKSKDVVVVDVPKKDKIPFAFIKKRSSHEIQDRTYYIRTTYGKKLVTDAELALLFTENRFPEGELKHRLSLEFNSSFNLINSEINSRENHFIEQVLQTIPFESRKEIFPNNQKLLTFILELYPYLVLKLFATYFRNSWHIGFTDSFDRTSSGAIINEVYEKESFSALSLDTNGFSLLQHYAPEYANVFRTLSSGDKFHLPKGSKISLATDDKYSQIKVESSLIDYSIEFWPLSYGCGVHQRNPFFEDNWTNPDTYDHFQKNFYHFDGACHFHFQIKVDNASYIEFHRLEQYVKSIDRLLKSLDINRILMDIPPKETRIVLRSVKEMLDILRPKPQPRSLWGKIRHFFTSKT